MTESTNSIPGTYSSRNSSDVIIEMNFRVENALGSIYNPFPTDTELNEMDLPEIVELIRLCAVNNPEIQIYLNYFKPKGILNSEYESRIFIQNMRSLYQRDSQSTEINDA